MKEKLEKAVLILLNTIYALSVPFLFFIQEIINNYYSSLEESSSYQPNTDISPLFIMVFLPISFFIFKIISFPFLYYMKIKLPYIHKFFNKLRIDRKLKNKILLGTFLLDTIFIIIFVLFFNIYKINFENTVSIIFTYTFSIVIMGLFFPYLLFFVFFPSPKQDNITEDDSIIVEQSKFLGIMTKIFLAILTILWLLITGLIISSIYSWHLYLV